MDLIKLFLRVLPVSRRAPEWSKLRGVGEEGSRAIEGNEGIKRKRMIQNKELHWYLWVINGCWYVLQLTFMKQRCPLPWTWGWELRERRCARLGYVNNLYQHPRVVTANTTFFTDCVLRCHSNHHIFSTSRFPPKSHLCKFSPFSWCLPGKLSDRIRKDISHKCRVN